MNIFERVTNEKLVIEVIRRIRERQPIPSMRANADDVFSALIKNHRRALMSERELRQILGQFVESKDIVIIGQVTHFKDKELIKTSPRGVVSKLHPKAKLNFFQWFSICGTPLAGSSGMNEYNVLSLEEIYIVADGLPSEVRKLQKRKPIDCY